MLILGGSQGARAVNRMVLLSLASSDGMLDGWKIVHQTGSQHAESVAKGYAELDRKAILSPFFPDLARRYRRATLVVSRAGATTLAELACAGCPAILVPYPNSTGDHQLKNACIYESAGAAHIVEQNGDVAETAADLSRELALLSSDRDLRDQMRQAMQTLARPRAAADVADRLLELTKKPKSSSVAHLKGGLF